MDAAGDALFLRRHITQSACFFTAIQRCSSIIDRCGPEGAARLASERAAWETTNEGSMVAFVAGMELDFYLSGLMANL